MVECERKWTHFCSREKGVSGPGPRTADVPPKSDNFNGKIKRIEPNWDFGFRLALGYNFCYDEWDGKISWAHYQTDKSESTSGIL